MKKNSPAPLRKTTDISQKNLEGYLRQAYARILVPEADGTFSAKLLEFPGCFAQGETADEAIRNLEEAAKSWIEAALDQGQEIPPPSSNQGYSGKIALRLPRSLHRAAMRKAQRDGISLNQCLVTAIASWVGADEVYTRYVERMTQPRIVIAAVSSYSQGTQFIPLFASITQSTAATSSAVEFPPWSQKRVGVQRNIRGEA